MKKKAFLVRNAEAGNSKSGTLLQLSFGPQERYVFPTGWDSTNGEIIANIAGIPLYREGSELLVGLCERLHMDNLVAMAGGEKSIEVVGADYSPKKASEHVDRKILEMAEAEIGASLRDCDITEVYALLRAKLDMSMTGKVTFTERLSKDSNGIYTFRVEKMRIIDWPDEAPESIRGAGRYMMKGDSIVASDWPKGGKPYQGYDLPRLDRDFASSAGGLKIAYV